MSGPNFNITNRIPVAYNTAASKPVYREEDFGDTAVIDGETRRQLSNVSYILMNDITVTVPFAIPAPGPVVLDEFVTFSASLYSAAVITYDHGNSGIPLFYGRQCASLEFLDIIKFTGDSSPVGALGVLFDCEFFNDPTSFCNFNCTFENWLEIGKLDNCSFFTQRLIFLNNHRGLSLMCGPDSDLIQITGYTMRNTVASGGSSGLSLSGTIGSISIIGGNALNIADNSFININRNFVYQDISLSSISYNSSTGGEFFRADEIINIDSITNSGLNPGNAVTINSATNHKLSDGDTIEIKGTGVYDGEVVVEEIIDDINFDVTTTYLTDVATGNFDHRTLNEMDLGINVSNCGDQKSSSSIGSFDMSGNVTVTSITQNVWTIPAGTTVAGANIEKWTMTNNFELTYDDTRPFNGVVNFGMGIEGASGSNIGFQLTIYKNAVQLPGIVRSFTLSNGQTSSVSITAPIVAAQNDVFDIRIQNTDSSSNATVFDCQCGITASG
jgi:hypothetical protein